MIVLTRHQDNVEAINSTLRNAGVAVRCNWIKELTDLGEALQQINAHMLVAFVGPDPADMTKVMTVARSSTAPTCRCCSRATRSMKKSSPTPCNRARATWSR